MSKALIRNILAALFHLELHSRYDLSVLVLSSIAMLSKGGSKFRLEADSNEFHFFCAIFLNDSSTYASSMHEWALAEAVIAAASEVAEKEQLRKITEVKIRIGELQQVDHEILEFALSQLKTAKSDKAKYILEREKARLKCRSCGHEWIFDRTKLDQPSAEAVHFIPEVAHTYIKCFNCGSPDFDVLEGRGILLESVKGER